VRFLAVGRANEDGGEGGHAGELAQIESLQRSGWPAAVAIRKRLAGRPPTNSAESPACHGIAPQRCAHPEATGTTLARTHPLSVVFRIYVDQRQSSDTLTPPGHLGASKDPGRLPARLPAWLNGRASSMPSTAGPQRGHIRTTNDQTTTDNSGHHRVNSNPARRANSAWPRRSPWPSPGP
jgi:hypothetical protein